MAIQEEINKLRDVKQHIIEEIEKIADYLDGKDFLITSKDLRLINEQIKRFLRDE